MWLNNARKKAECKINADKPLIKALGRINVFELMKCRQQTLQEYEKKIINKNEKCLSDAKCTKCNILLYERVETNGIDIDVDFPEGCPVCYDESPLCRGCQQTHMDRGCEPITDNEMEEEPEEDEEDDDESMSSESDDEVVQGFYKKMCGCGTCRYCQMNPNKIYCDGCHVQMHADLEHEDFEDGCPLCGCGGNMCRWCYEDHECETSDSDDTCVYDD